MEPVGVEVERHERRDSVTLVARDHEEGAVVEHPLHLRIQDASPRSDVEALGPDELEVARVDVDATATLREENRIGTRAIAPLETLELAGSLIAAPDRFGEGAVLLEPPLRSRPGSRGR